MKEEEMKRYDAEKDIPRWEKIKDIVDQFIDFMLNYRQSGHPGGSRSKVHACIALLLSGAMRWDIRHPEKPFSDRFVLGAGHTIPMVYATLAVFNEALRIKYRQTKDERYNPGQEERVLYWEDLTAFRRRGGLSGHAEMQGKTLFLKFNTGPSGHGAAAAVGQAVALKRAKAHGVKVFVLEGEGGLTPGSTHEAANSAYGLALDNYYMLVDWNDFGIDNHRTSTIVHGSPEDWFSSHGWETYYAGNGEDWKSLADTFLNMTTRENPSEVPRAAWFTSRKGRGYLKYDNFSHGSPHKTNDELFWKTKQPFMEAYGVEFIHADPPSSPDSELLMHEFKENLKITAEVLAEDQPLVDYLADRLVEIGDSVPQEIPASVINPEISPFDDPLLYDVYAYPGDLFAEPGTKAANRAALATWGAWINAYGKKVYGRPLVLACSADLSESTNISGFAEPYRDVPGWGWFKRVGSEDGALLPQGITEFVNSGITVGLASVNFSSNPYESFNGFWGATSTYGSFSYLVYGMLRLYSQMDQDCELNLGKAIYIAGHTGPETADDSRTHFGIFSPGITQLFPKGRVINLYPWEHNEVPVLLGSALKLKKPSVVVLHLTRPPIEIPDREQLGIPSHFEAARGAYIVCDFKEDCGTERKCTVFVQGTSVMSQILTLLPTLDKPQYNVKIVYVSSPQLFELQPEEYRKRVVTECDKIQSTIITTSARNLMPEFTFTEASRKFAIASDWDDRWRTGGTLEEVLDEAHLTHEWILKGIDAFLDYLTDRKTESGA
jgi:transketolase